MEELSMWNTRWEKLLLVVLLTFAIICYALTFFVANGEDVNPVEEEESVLFGPKYRFEAQEEPQDVILFVGYNDERLIIREEPKPHSKKLGRFEPFSQICVLEDLGDWYRVPEGYVMSKYVILGEVPDKPQVNFDDLNTNTLKVGEMPYLNIMAIGTLSQRVKGTCVTGSGSLYFEGVIPIYGVSGEYAYFPSGRNIYKIAISKFSSFEDVGPNFNIIAAYRTVYWSSTASRKHNIQLVSSKLNGTIIKSGATFSYNKTTGPRGYKEGYEIATVINNGQYVEDYGGGVCQVSSTIYASIINDPKFIIVARKPHALEVKYLPYGMDATVSYGGTDFKFKNNYNFDVMLNVYADEGACIVTITRVN